MFSVKAIMYDPWLVLQPNVDVALEFARTVRNLVGTNLSLKIR